MGIVGIKLSYFLFMETATKLINVNNLAEIFTR